MVGFRFGYHHHCRFPTPPPPLPLPDFSTAAALIRPLHRRTGAAPSRASISPGSCFTWLHPRSRRQGGPHPVAIKKLNQRRLQMDSNRAHWDPAVTSFFLDLCIAVKDKFNWNKQGLTRDGWRNVCHLFREKYGPMFTNRQMSNKLQGLKLRYNNWMNLQNSSGLGRNKTTGGVEVEDEWFQPTDSNQGCSEPDVS
ncbi:hypothetical protein C2845_PM11G06450 [Panicum miliaceum]|uniref:Myb/SANT-like domain-containing protein n=1 Tax=Panicum miliaceum TaxID=4540 RepID=A0A3L6RP41_PANMI|nr:hypothetical protein C2845_PM11G06450 [Panicum miliaceum]